MIARCDKLAERIGTEAEVVRRVYLKRLKSCRELFAYVLSARKTRPALISRRRGRRGNAAAGRPSFATAGRPGSPAAGRPAAPPAAPLRREGRLGIGGPIRIAAAKRAADSPVRFSALTRRPGFRLY